MVLLAVNFFVDFLLPRDVLVQFNQDVFLVLGLVHLWLVCTCAIKKFLRTGAMLGISRSHGVHPQTGRVSTR